MTNGYNPGRHGRTSELEPENDAVRWEWDEARKLGDGWVPTASIFLRDDLQPRIESPIDLDTARRYADAFDLLPPVQVQRGTLTLIDGRHRVRAAYLSNPQRLWIRVVEMDVSDEELIDYAVKANVSHGRPATATERKYWAKDFLKRHTDWSDRMIAEWTGGDRMTILTLRGQMEAKAEIEHTTTRIGADGKTRNVSASQGRQPAKNSQVETDVTSPVEPEPEADSAPVVTATTTHVAGGKPAGYFPVGSELYDMLGGHIVTLLAKDTQTATLKRYDGNTYVVDVVRDVRFALHTMPPKAAAPAAPMQTPANEDTSAARDMIAAFAEITASTPAAEFRGSLTEAERRYYQVLATNVVEWLAEVFEAVP